jgi:hypothetical protein
MPENLPTEENFKQFEDKENKKLNEKRKIK